MACGTLVLSSRVGGVPELVVEGETGWMFAPRDDEAQREKLAWVLDHLDAVPAIGTRVRRAAVVGARLGHRWVDAAARPGGP